MKTGTLLASIAGLGALAFFAVRKANAKSSAALWCAGSTVGSCDVTGSSAQDVAEKYLAGQPISGAGLAVVDAAAGGGQQTWGITSGGATVAIFYVWRQ